MRARKLLRLGSLRLSGLPPATPVGRRARRALLAEQTIRSVLELAVRFGESMLSLGAAGAEVTAAITRVCRVFGLECQVDVTFTSILVATDGTDDTAPVSVLRVVQTRAADYDRLARIVDLVRGLDPNPAAARVGDALEERGVRDSARDFVEATHAQLDEILDAPHRYRRTVVTLLLMVMAAGVALLLGGGPLIVVIAAVTTALIDTVIRVLAHWGLPAFFLQVAGAAVAAIVAAGILAALPYVPLEIETVPPGVVVASGIIVLLAGMSLVGAVDDAINGFPVTASGRLLEVMLLTLGIVVGILGVLDIARRLGVELVLAQTTANPWPLAVQVAGAAVASGAWAMSSYASLRTSLVAGAAGGGAYLVLTSLDRLDGVSTPAATAAAALLIGFAGEWLGARTRYPAIVVAVCGIVPLLPGVALYQGLMSIASGEPLDTSVRTLAQAGAIGLALAAGTTLGGIIARRVVTPRIAGASVLGRVTPGESVPEPRPGAAHVGGTASEADVDIRSVNSDEAPDPEPTPDR